MTRPRVAVVGAGPAGSTAARLLAVSGAEVVLFEARPLPRTKLCGGGLTSKAQRLVPDSALRTVERRVDRVELRGPHIPPAQLFDPAASIAMVERSRFDLALVEAATEAGVEVRDGDPVRELLEQEACLDVRTDRDRWRAEAVVIADGEPSGTARKVGLGGPARRRALALEVDLPFADAIERDTAVLSYRIAGGFGWYFPKGDHANVGVGSHRLHEIRMLREDLAGFASELGLDLAQARVGGHWIPQGLRQGPLASRRVVLAGDAAATADALFGEGISYAILSGIVAAQAIGDWAEGRLADLMPYDARLRAALGPTLDRLDVIARAVELSVSVALLAVQVSTQVRERAVDAIAGRRAPYAIDAHCELACACELHASVSTMTASATGAPTRPMDGHCRLCSADCAA